MLLLPYTLIGALGYSATLAGLAVLPFPIIVALGSPLMGKLAARIGPRWPLTVGALIVAGGYALSVRISVDGDYLTTVLPAILAVSLGMAIAVAPLTTAVLSAVDEHHVGTASGLNSAVSRAGGLIVTALLGAVLSQQGAASGRRASRRRAGRRGAGPALGADRVRDAGRGPGQTFVRNGVNVRPLVINVDALAPLQPADHDIGDRGQDHLPGDLQAPLGEQPSQTIVPASHHAGEGDRIEDQAVDAPAPPRSSRSSGSRAACPSSRSSSARARRS